MARATDRLSARRVDSAKEPGLYPDGNGLYLRIGPSGAKSWVYRYRNAGKRHDLGLGPYPVVTLADARERAMGQRRLRLDGRDPLMTKREGRDQVKLDAAKAMTFAACADAYMTAHQAGWRNSRHAKQWAATLATYVNPVFGQLPVQAIDVGLVMKVIEPMWTVKPDTASRVRGRIESVLDWATARGYRTGENSARWRGHLENLLPKLSRVRRIEHHPALPYPEIAAFMAQVRQQKDVASRALEFLILTAARTGEVIGAKWLEIDAAARLWVIPGERMKSGKEHRVPLSDAVMALLGDLSRGGDCVFHGNADKPLNKSALMVRLRKMGRTDLTAHGFRSTFRDWCAESTHYPSEIAEMALGHIVGSAVEQAYRRSDMFAKRRQVMDAWARFCAQPQRGQVVAIGAR